MYTIAVLSIKAYTTLMIHITVCYYKRKVASFSYVQANMKTVSQTTVSVCQSKHFCRFLDQQEELGSRKTPYWRWDPNVQSSNDASPGLLHELEYCIIHNVKFYTCTVSCCLPTRLDAHFVCMTCRHALQWGHQMHLREQRCLLGCWVCELHKHAL